MAIDWKRVHPPLVAISHILGALLIAYLFIVVLMTASLQNQVAKTLGDLDPPLDYSTAYTMMRASRDLDRQIVQLAGRSRELGEARTAARNASDDAFDDFLVRAAPFNALVPRLEANGCTIGLAPTDPDAVMRAADPDKIARALIQIRDCTTDRQLPEPLARDAARVLATSSELIDGARAWWKPARAVDRNEALIAGVNHEVDLARTERAGLDQARHAFDAMTALDRGVLFGGGALAELPPSIIHIVLAFVSGMFGALLLTLVFVVYPGNGLQLTTSQGGYGPRILLGGLISVCVFVVIGGGTAVLGATSALAEGDSNFLAFCAIGILAGMFSDRVTVWLSERANTFFTSQEGGAGGEPQGGPGVPPDVAEGAGERSPEVEPEEPAEEPGAPPDDPETPVDDPDAAPAR